MSNKPIRFSKELCDKIEDGTAGDNTPVTIVDVGGEQMVCEDKFVQLQGVYRYKDTALYLRDFEISPIKK